MKTTTLGKNGPVISQFGLGAMSFAGFYGPATEAEAHDVLDVCRDGGVTHIDTANVYGMGVSETMIGTWLAARAGARNDMVIATKAAITPDRVFDNSPEHLEAELDKSLARLGIDAVDLFYVHRRDPNCPIEEVAGTLGRLVEAGKTKAIGFSEIAPSSLRKAHGEYPVAAVQSEYSLSTRFPELGLVQTCKELEVALVAFSPVGRSYLTDRPFSWEASQQFSFTKPNPRFTAENYAENIRITDGFRALAAEMGEPAAAVAIAWIMAQGTHVIPIPGTRNANHMRELIKGTEITLSDADHAAIDAVLPVGWAHGDRYSVGQWAGPERYC